MPNGVVRTNHVQLNQGAILDVGEIMREDSDEGLPEVQGTVAVDINQNAQSGFSIGSSTDGQFNAYAHFSMDSNLTIHQPTVLAKNIAPSDLANVNTSRENISQTSHHNTGFSIAAVKLNPEKVQAQKEEIVEAAQRIGRGVQRGLHFMFARPAPSQAASPISIPEPENTKPLIAEVKEVFETEPHTESSYENFETENEEIQNLPNQENEEILSLSHQESEDDALIGQMCFDPILKELEHNLIAKLYYAQLTPKERSDLIQMVTDYRNGVPNLQLMKIEAALSQKKPTAVNRLIHALNPISDAQANPLVIVPAAAFMYLLGAFGVKWIQSVQESGISNFDYPDNRNDITIPPFPIHQEDPPIYVGIAPNEAQHIEDNKVSFPIMEDLLPKRYEFPAKPRKIKDFIISTTIITGIAGLHYLYNKDKSQPDYEANDKHRYGNDFISVDPFYHHPEEAEKLLKEAIEKGYQVENKKQLYSPIWDANGELHVFVFQPTHNDAREYHGYLYETSEGKNYVDTDILKISKKWKKEGVIEKKEYKKIINGKMNWKRGNIKVFL